MWAFPDHSLYWNCLRQSSQPLFHYLGRIRIRIEDGSSPKPARAFSCCDIPYFCAQLILFRKRFLYAGWYYFWFSQKPMNKKFLVGLKAPKAMSEPDIPLLQRRWDSRGSLTKHSCFCWYTHFYCQLWYFYSPFWYCPSYFLPEGGPPPTRKRKQGI